MQLLPCHQTAAADNPAAAAVATANNAFAFALLNQVEGGEDNFACSPLSIWSALTMTSAGAEKETLAQMRKVLHLPDSNDVHEQVGAWSKALQASEKVEIRIANRLWGNKTLPLKESFLKLTEKAYGAGLETVDFANQPDASRTRINEWVAQETKDRIKDLLKPEDIRPDTRLVLTNAVYFKGKWLRPFDAHSTASRTFTLATGKTIEAKSMRKSMPLAYMENADLQAVRLPYQGNTTSMIVVLPRKADALLKAGFVNEDQFNAVIAALKSEPQVVVELPRFEVSARLALESTLAAMGMGRAFSDDAEFGAMSSESLKIAKVIHQAWVKVAEEGTEAAAATAVTMMPTGALLPKEEPKLFLVERPFLFFIMDDKTNGVLFTGKVMQPEKAK
ncbi:serpin family protein [Roseimicrobium sp. ORNL1]|uniref:serpin family protein n=1 Tax=Roseimicrobium sp. ORNL1 TaxID=2711231 RepID=UPI0013E1E1E7|nr:serpin family protein [Roseimicrobium sp. ORNL1]QIF04650.1 serpin family protein [Roseimicrobium sp. ORNL1]